MGSKIVARAFTLTLLLAPVSALVVVACGSGDDRPRPADTTFTSGGSYGGEGGASTGEGGAGGLTISILDAGAWCREADGGVAYERETANGCMCPPADLNGVTFNLSCGWGVCLSSGPGAVCQPDRTVTLHDDCPADGSFPPEWLAACVHDQ